MYVWYGIDEMLIRSEVSHAFYCIHYLLLSLWLFCTHAPFDRCILMYVWYGIDDIIDPIRTLQAKTLL